MSRSRLFLNLPGAVHAASPEKLSALFIRRVKPMSPVELYTWIEERNSHAIFSADKTACRKTATFA
jgi:hypothetical protein